MAYAAYAKPCPACLTLTTFSADLGDEHFIAQCPCCGATYQEPTSFAAPKPAPDAVPAPAPAPAPPDMDKDDPARETNVASHVAASASRFQFGDKATQGVPSTPAVLGTVPPPNDATVPVSVVEPNPAVKNEDA